VLSSQIATHLQESSLLPCREQDAAATVQTCAVLAVNVVMLTGDNPATAQGVGEGPESKIRSRGSCPVGKLSCRAPAEGLSHSRDGWRRHHDAPRAAQANVRHSHGHRD